MILLAQEDDREELRSARIPLVLDNFLEAVDHAIVRLGAGGLASLQLTTICQYSMSSDGARDSYTRVLTTSSGYLGELADEQSSTVLYEHLHDQDLFEAGN